MKRRSVIKSYLAMLGAKGGAKRSRSKVAAARRNVRKAIAARKRNRLAAR